MTVNNRILHLLLLPIARRTRLIAHFRWISCTRGSHCDGYSQAMQFAEKALFLWTFRVSHVLYVNNRARQNSVRNSITCYSAEMRKLRTAILIVISNEVKNFVKVCFVSIGSVECVPTIDYRQPNWAHFSLSFSLSYLRDHNQAYQATPFRTHLRSRGYQMEFKQSNTFS